METNNTTPFLKALNSVRTGEIKAPEVSYGKGTIDYFKYQLNTHLFNLKVMATGMKFRGVRFSDIKKYYGLKGKSAKDCLPELTKILDDYEKGLI